MANSNTLSKYNLQGRLMICSAPTVAALPKLQQGDFINAAMMVLLSTGELVGWGDNTTGCLANANGLATTTYGPVQRILFDPNTTMPPADATIVGWAFTNANLYVILSNGWCYSAGRNDYGQLGQGDTTARAQLKRIEYFVTNDISVTGVWAVGNISTSYGGGCVDFQTSSYSMYACGANSQGNLGNASTPTSNVTTPAPCAGVSYSSTSYVTDVQIISTGTLFSAYMLYNTGELLVAGYNGWGQLATGNTTSVTGSFVSAKITGSTNVSNFASICVNGGSNGTYDSGNAIAIDTSGNIWSVGWNAYGELGQGNTTNPYTLFTQISGLSNVIATGIGGGYVGSSYALTASGTFHTWGYNGNNTLFQNSTTTPITVPTVASFVPGTVSGVFFPKGNYASVTPQMIVLTTSGQLVYAGGANGQLSIANTVNPGAYFYIPAPRPFPDGTKTIANVFVHGYEVNQRWFILSTDGHLYASGSNTGAICTGGVCSNVIPPYIAWYEIGFTNL